MGAKKVSIKESEKAWAQLTKVAVQADKEQAAKKTRKPRAKKQPLSAGLQGSAVPMGLDGKQDETAYQAGVADEVRAAQHAEDAAELQSYGPTRAIRKEHFNLVRRLERDNILLRSQYQDTIEFLTKLSKQLTSLPKLAQLLGERGVADKQFFAALAEQDKLQEKLAQLDPPAPSGPVELAESDATTWFLRRVLSPDLVVQVKPKDQVR